MSQGYTEIKIALTDEQFKLVQHYLLNIKQNPGTYNLFTQQCTSIAANALQAGGIQLLIPSKMGRVPLGAGALLLPPEGLKNLIERFNKNLIFGHETYYKYKKK